MAINAVMQKKYHTCSRIIMVRIKIIKAHKNYKVGETVYVTKNEAHGLIDSGFAQQTKDMTSTDYVTRKVKRGHSS